MNPAESMVFLVIPGFSKLFEAEQIDRQFKRHFAKGTVRKAKKYAKKAKARGNRRAARVALKQGVEVKDGKYKGWLS